MIHILLISLRDWLSRLAPPEAVADPLAGLSPRDWADLPAHHPLCDPCDA